MVSHPGGSNPEDILADVQRLMERKVLKICSGQNSMDNFPEHGVFAPFLPDSLGNIGGIGFGPEAPENEGMVRLFVTKHFNRVGTNTTRHGIIQKPRRGSTSPSSINAIGR